MSALCSKFDFVWIILLLFAVVIGSSQVPQSADDALVDESETVVIDGQIDGGDDILSLINSSFMIVDIEAENSTDIVENGTSEETLASTTQASPSSTLTTEHPEPPLTVLPEESVTTRPLPRLRLSKPKPRSRNLARECQQYSEVEKYKMLGSRNQLFMANSIMEAGLHFGSLFHEDLDMQNDFAAPTSENTRQFSTSDGQICDSRCQFITRTLRTNLPSRTAGRKKTVKLNDDGVDPDFDLLEVQEGRPSEQTKNGCYLDTFLKLGNCSTNSWMNPYDQLCSRCHGIYTLGPRCFPQFLNAVSCSGVDTGCIYDRNDDAHGVCRPQYLTFRVLQNIGVDDCEVWKPMTIELPVACQCLLNKNSPFLSADPL